MLSYNINILGLLQVIVNYLGNTLVGFDTRKSLNFFKSTKTKKTLTFFIAIFYLSHFEVLTMSVINTERLYQWESITDTLLLPFRHLDEDKFLSSDPVQLFTWKDNLFEELVNKSHSGSS